MWLFHVNLTTFEKKYIFLDEDVKLKKIKCFFFFKIRTPFFSTASYGPDRSEEKKKGGGRGGGGWLEGVLHYFYSASGFYKFICPRPPHFLSASYAPEYHT